MTIIPALPYTLTNGTTADANQVMADLNNILTGVNTNGAANGPNSDITSLTGLTTPLSVSQGGTGANNAAGALVDLGAAPIKGVTDGSNAVAGNIGEYISNSASGVTLISNTATNITSIALTAGDWDVFGTLSLASNNTVASLFAGGANTVSATLPATPNFAQLSTTTTNWGSWISAIPPQRFSITATTTIYLVGIVVFGSGTGTGGGILSARRRR